MQRLQSIGSRQRQTAICPQPDIPSGSKIAQQGNSTHADGYPHVARVGAALMAIPDITSAHPDLQTDATSA